MAESNRRNRRTARPSVEALEGRIVLSGVYGGQTSPTELHLQAEIERRYASPQSGTVNLTVSRMSPDTSRAIVFKVATDGRIDTMKEVRAPAPRSVGPRSKRWPTGPDPGVASGGTEARVVSQHFRTAGRSPSSLPMKPIDGVYRIKPGQASVTIPVRLNPNFSTPGEVTLEMWVRVPGTGAGAFFPGNTGSSLTIVPSPDRVPPEIISTSLAPGAITLTFSKPMDPATVEDVNNYVITGEGVTSIGPGALVPAFQVPVTLSSAAYDPATRTVTLTPTEPLDPALYYHLRTPAPGFTPVDPIPRLDAAKPLLDLQGNPLRGNPSDYGYIGLPWT